MKIKPAYSNSGPNNPASGPPISSVPPFFKKCESDRKGKPDFKVGKTKGVIFFYDVVVVLLSFYSLTH